MLRLTTFGGLALSRDGTPLTGAAAQRSRLSLLALLATSGPTGFSRDKLLLHLWPESDEERARHALKQAVYSLRRELGADDVIVGTASLTLNPLIITSDAREFEAAIASGDFVAAAGLYTGPFLDGFHLKDSVEFERWSGEQRARYAHMWTTAVERLASDCESRGGWREAAGYWRTLASSEPLSGRLALALIRCLAESGDLGAALQQYKVHEALLREELDGAPEPEVVAFAESLRTGTWKRSPEKPQGRQSPPAMASAPVVAASVPPAGVAERPAPVEAPAPREPALPTQTGTYVSRRVRRRSTAVAFGLGALFVLVMALTVRYATLDPDDKAALNTLITRPKAKLEPRQIVVAPFENMTGDTTLNPLGELVADWFAREVNEAGFRVVDSRTARFGTKVVDAIPAALRARDRDVALGEETGSAYAVVGSYHSGEGDSLQANVSVIDVATKQTKKTLGPFYGSRRNANAFIIAMLKPTIAYLGAEVDTSAGASTVKYSSPPSLEAFTRVSHAWERFFESPRDTASVFAELDSAAKLDSTYATPLLMKAYILDVKSQWAGAAEIVKRVRPLAPRMSKLERAALDLFEADLRGDATSRLEHARRLSDLSPGSTEMPLLMVVSALYLGRPADAIAALRKIDPKRGINLKAPTYLEWAAEAQHHAGDIAGEERSAREALRLFRHHPPATYALVRVLAVRNDSELRATVDRGVPPARNPADDPRDAVGDRQDLMLLAGRELRAHGHAAAADTFFRAVARELEQLPPNATMAQLRRQADAWYEMRDYARAKTAFAALAEKDATDLELLTRHATSAAHTGDSATVRALDKKLVDMKRPFLMGRELRSRANIAAVQGRTAEAIALLERAVRQGHRLMDTPLRMTVHLDADFVEAVKHPAYAAMLQSLAQ